MLIGPDTQPPLRLISRIINEVLLDTIIAWKREIGGDLSNATIVVAVYLANTEHILQDPALMSRFRRCAPPPDLHVPAPQTNLASITGFDDETLRRRVNQLCEVAVLAKDGLGITINPAFYASEGYKRLERFSSAAIGQLLSNISAFDVAVEFFTSRSSIQLPSVGSIEDFIDNCQAICHILYLKNFARIIMEKFVLFGDSKNISYVGFGYIVECLRHITNNQVLAVKYATVDTPAPDSAKAPISIRKMAGLLELPVETVRRHVSILHAGSVLIAVDGGFVPSTSAVMDGDIMLWQASLVSRMASQLAAAIETLPSRD